SEKGEPEPLSPSCPGCDLPIEALRLGLRGDCRPRVRLPSCRLDPKALVKELFEPFASVMHLEFESTLRLEPAAAAAELAEKLRAPLTAVLIPAPVGFDVR